MGELKQKHRQIKEKKVLNRDEVYHGALEDILMGVYKCDCYTAGRNAQLSLVQIASCGIR